MRIIPSRCCGLLATVICIVAALFLGAGTAVGQGSHKRVLLLFDEDKGLPGLASLDQSLRSTLNAGLNADIEFFTESMDLSQFNSEHYEDLLSSYYLKKYRDRKPDLIVAVMGPSLTFLLRHGDTIFPGIPVVFCGVDPSEIQDVRLPPRITGILVRRVFGPTLEVVFRLQPQTEHVFVVGGNSTFDQHLVAAAQREFQPFERRASFTYLTDLSMRDLLTAVSQLPQQSVILYLTLFRDAAGDSFVPHDAVHRISVAADAPVYVFVDQYLSQGPVGGYLYSVKRHGKTAAEIGLRVLSGESPGAIPIRESQDSAYMFDWRALKRWGLRESDLPSGSTVLFRELSVWERNKRIWISGLLVILALSLLSTYLHYSRAELKKARDAQVQLSGHIIDAQEKERSRLASELHDDFSQRLALLALRLENTADTLPDSSNTLKRALVEFRQSVAELGDDLHSLSHQLHSSTLDTLGLVAGLSSLCREFGAWQGIEIDFTSADIPRNVRPDVSLCLFRITQEGLQNLKKHSNTKRAQLSVRHMGDKLFLSLCDEGIGFDANTLEKPGLGILSMRGRARLLGGDFEIHSKPGRGTRIEAWVPLDEPVADQLNV